MADTQSSSFGSIVGWLLDFTILSARSHDVSVPEKMLENDGTQVTPVSNVASTPSCHENVSLGATWVPSLKRVFQDPQPVDGRGRLPLKRTTPSHPHFNSRALVSLQDLPSGFMNGSGAWGGIAGGEVQSGYLGWRAIWAAGYY